MPGSERLTLEIAASTVGQESVDRLSASIESLAQVSSRAGIVGGGAGRQIGEAFESSVPRIAAASGAIREFEGSIPIRAVERFLTTTLGMGDVIMKAFPLIGGIAFAGMLVETGKHLYDFIQKFDPLTQAQNRASEATKALSGEFKNLNSEITRLLQQDFENLNGKKASLQAQAAALTNSNIPQAAMAYGLGADIARLEARKKTEVSAYTTRAPGEKQSPIDIDIATAQHQQAAFQETIQQNARMSASLSRQAAQIQSGDNDERDKLKASEAAKADELKKRQTDEWNKITAATVSNMVGIATPYGNTSASVREFQAKQFSVDSKFGEDDARQQDADARKDKENHDSDQAFQRKLQEEADQREQARHEEAVRVSNSQINTVRDSGDRQARIAGIGAQPDDAMSVASKQLAIRLQTLAQEKAIVDANSQDYDLKVESYRLDKEANDATLDYMSALAEYTAKQKEQFRSVSGSLFDAITSGKNKEIENYFQGIGKDLGKTIFENLAKQAEPNIMGAIPHVSDANSFLGKMLANTPFAAKGGTAVTLDSAGTKLIQAAMDLSSVAKGGVPGSATASVPGSATASVGGSSVAGSGIGGSPLGGGLLSMGGLPAGGIDVGGSPLGGGILDMKASLPAASKSALSTTAGLVTAATAASAGIFSAVKLFDGSGASGVAGKLTDTAGIAASVGAILPLVSSSLALAGPIGMAVGAALPLIASLFPSGPSARANAIWKETTQGQYMAPTALNQVETSNGNYASVNFRGGLDQTGFSARPQVTDPYLYWGPHNNPVQAPGSVISPFSPQTAQQPAIELHVHTMDAASFVQFANTNKAALANAVTAHVQAGNSQLVQVMGSRLGVRH